jgi:hypothetical protein
VIEALQSQIEELKGITSTFQQKELKSQVNTLKEKHPDFTQYKEAILKLANDNPSLELEELYILAKKRAGKLKLSNPTTFSEKPSSQPRRHGSTKREQARTRMESRKGFNDTLAKALEDISFD